MDLEASVWGQRYTSISRVRLTHFYATYMLVCVDGGGDCSPLSRWVIFFVSGNFTVVNTSEFLILNPWIVSPRKIYERELDEL